MRSWTIALAVWLPASVSALDPAAADEGLDAFVAAQGCAIGPQTTIMALEAGHERKALDALVATADAAGAVRTGD